VVYNIVFFEEYFSVDNMLLRALCTLDIHTYVIFTGVCAVYNC